MKYYLAIEKKEILPLLTAWMNLESIVLNEISQSEKDKYHMILLTSDSNEQNRNRFIDTENRVTAVRREEFWMKK